MKSLAIGVSIFALYSAQASEPGTRTITIVDSEVYALVVKSLVEGGIPVFVNDEHVVAYQSEIHQIVVNIAKEAVQALAVSCEIGTTCSPQSTRLVDCNDGRAWFFWWREGSDNWDEMSLAVCATK